jgi:apolipoprotein N-acyltransferase
MILKSMSEMKKNKLLAIFLGAICSLAFAPFHFFPAAIISLSGLYFLLEKSDEKKAFWLGFYYGFGYFLSGVYWIAISLLVDAEKFAWLIPFALTLIPSALALYLALFALAYKFLIKKFSLTENYQKILIFSLCWLFGEILRSTLFTGFPWNLLGYIWMFDVHFAQLANVFGIYGLTIFAALTCLFPVLFIGKQSKSDKIFAAILAIFFTSNFLYGYFHIDDKKLIHSEMKLRLVQANIKQEMKWDPAQKYQNFLRQIELTNSQKLNGIEAVIWSETSLPYLVDSNPELLERLKLATPPQGMLITGGLRIEEGSGNVWNSVFAIDQNGVFNSYDKHHLVPFGEYLPGQKYWEKYLPFIKKITDGAVGFSEGDGPKTIATQGFSFSPLLCYEVIFSGQITDKNSRPDLLVNLTNDAWFGNSSGPYQHFDMARMRAIEQGISLARVANTGISALIDPFGRVVKRINLNQSGIADVNLIKNLAPTIYEKYGASPLALLITAMLISLLIFLPKNHNDTRQNNTC